MLKPRAETGGERKSKPKERIVNPRFQARNTRVLQAMGGPAQGKLSQARAKGVDRNSKQYKKLEKAASDEKYKKFQNYFVTDNAKANKTYTKKQKDANARKVEETIKQIPIRNRAEVKQIIQENPVAAEKTFGKAGAERLARLATRTGKAGKGGGKVRKTDVRAVTATQRITERSGKTTKSYKDGLLQQRYSKGGKVKKGQNARPQRDTRFKGETAPVRGSKASPKKAGGFKKKTGGGKAPKKK